MNQSRRDDGALGRVLGGKYRIDKLLDQGSMGTVYQGLKLDDNRPVAIKVIAGALASNPECVGRFRREAAAMAKLRHPNTVRLLDAELEGPQPYMIMELLEGADLSRYIARRGRLPERAALEIVRQVLCALVEAHALGIIHRDLKPANVFLSRADDGRVVAKLMDFGVAGVGSDGGHKLTVSGSVIGTPSYMSPEQAQGTEVDPRTDLYGLGMMLFEMLTGRMPFEGDSSVSMLLAQLMQPVPRLLAVAPDRPELLPLQPLLDTLLAKTPEGRPGSAAAVLALIEQLAHTLPR